MNTNEQEGMSRRTFIGTAAAALLAGISIHVLGCSSDGGAGTAPGNTPDKTGDISDNHGHEAVITGAQLNAGGALNLDIEGSSGHVHFVSLTAQDVADIKAGIEVSRESSSEEAGHSHQVTFNLSPG